MLYDEPTTGLDPVTTDVIGDLIEQTSRKHNVTSIVVTHDMQSAYKISDRISMLYEGEIIFTGTPQEIQESTNPIIVQFINGEAKGPITHHEQEVISQLSNDLIRKSLLIRKIHLHDDRP